MHMSQESQPIGMSATRNVTYRTDTSDTTNNLQTEQVTTQPIMSDPVTARLINPFHNTIDLSTTEGKNICLKATAGLPTNEKYFGESKDSIKFVERIETCAEDFGWKIAGEGIGARNLSVFTTPGSLTIDVIKAHCGPKWKVGKNPRCTILHAL